MQLGRNMALFEYLSRFQRFLARLEIATGILPVFVEKQAEHTAVQVIMVSRVSAGPDCWIQLIKPPLTPAPPFQDRFRWMRIVVRHIQHEIVEQRVK